MIVMSTYAIRPGCVPEAVSRYLPARQHPQPASRFSGDDGEHDASGGYTLFETDNPTALFEFAASWSDVLETHSNVVIEDAEAAPVLAKIYGK